MHKKLIEFNLSQRRTDLPELRSGDVVKVYRKIKEGGKERTQMFEGMIIAIKGGQSSSPTITVRKVSAGIGVELVLPLNSAQIEKIILVKRTRARRAKLYFVRSKSGKVLSKKLKEVAIKAPKAAPVTETTPEVDSQAPAEEAVAQETSTQEAETK
jgi:large subunit ribosomal protein L19